MRLIAERHVAVSAAHAWHVVGECFAHIAHWAAPIETSRLDAPLGPGATRHCRTTRFGPVAPTLIQEQLLTFDRERQTFTYQSIAGMPSFIAAATNTWSVHALGPQACLVRTEAEVHLKGAFVVLTPLLQVSFTRNGSRVLNQLKYFAELGQPHPEKMSALERSGLKVRALPVC